LTRADLLIRLVQAGVRGDKTSLKKVVEAIISEEIAKQHTVLAEKLEETIRTALFDAPAPNSGAPRLESHEVNLFHEIMPYRKLSDLIFPEETILICQSLIDEQHRADLLRSYNLEPRHRLLLIGPPGNGCFSMGLLAMARLR
jgi:hypothetical protein